jgi:hypothetical protein
MNMGTSLGIDRLTIGHRAGRSVATDFPARLAKGPSQQELDLTVQAAQVIVRPTLHLLQHVGIDAQQE